MIKIKVGEFLKRKKRFTLENFEEETNIAKDMIYIVLRQLERWGYIEKRRNEYYVIKERVVKSR